ncbi:MAG: gliding motility-associated C-terminal domain-containing protein [Prevotella sp.]|nr:gliding motility-associated C-terminal domain-containing protein [Prevotella sp.]
MKLNYILLLVSIFASISHAFADDEYPSISPMATIIEADKETQTNEHTGSAPLTARFAANPSNDSGWQAYYEWRFYEEGKEDDPYLVRYEQDTEYTFTTAGAHYIVLYAIFTQGDNRIEYTQEYWAENEPIKISISESKLEMPNAFSPNDDGKNDIYRAKPGYQSIVSFRAIIFNRWGQKLYEWNDPAGGWDGTYKGSPVKQGTYFVLVDATGADGRHFNIKRDVNLLRGYTEKSGSSDGGSSTAGE